MTKKGIDVDVDVADRKRSVVARRRRRVDRAERKTRNDWLVGQSAGQTGAISLAGQISRTGAVSLAGRASRTGRGAVAVLVGGRAVIERGRGRRRRCLARRRVERPATAHAGHGEQVRAGRLLGGGSPRLGPHKAVTVDKLGHSIGLDTGRLGCEVLGLRQSDLGLGCEDLGLRQRDKGLGLGESGLAGVE